MYIKTLLLLCSSLLCLSVQAGEVYKSTQTLISFFSSTPIEDIKATSTEGGSAINFENKKIFFKVSISSFEFKNSLMQEHFNENYMESDDYPYAQYSGILNTSIDPSIDSTYTLSTTGDLTIHGVTKKYTVPITLSINEGMVKGNCTFNVKVADHKIKIPRLVVKKIAQTIEVNANAIYKKI